MPTLAPVAKSHPVRTSDIPASHLRSAHTPVAEFPLAEFPIVSGGVGTIPAVPATASQCPLQLRIHAALAAQTFVPGKSLRIETGDGRVTLHGRVKSYFHKQMAQETLRGIEGIATIDNRLVVEWDEKSTAK